MQLTTSRRRPMPCDLLVPDPILSFTHAIDLAVSPERAWPWLAQMGAERAGWYVAPANARKASGAPTESNRSHAA